MVPPVPGPLLLVLSLLGQSGDATGELLGLCRDPQGRPVAGAAVTVRLDWSPIATFLFWKEAPVPERVLARGRTDRAGRFSVRVPKGPLYRITIEDRQRGRATLSAYCDRPILAVLGREQGGDPPRASSRETAVRARLTGVVRDADRRPIDGAIVRGPWRLEPLARTDEHGRFDLGITAEIAADPLFVVRPGYRFGVVPAERLPEQGESQVEIVLRRGEAMVVGRLVGRDRKPLSGLTILVDSDIPVGADHSYGEVPWTVRTDAQGTFRVAELAKGARYLIRTLLDDGTPVELAQGFANEPHRDLGTIPTEPRTAVFGRVRWRGGSAVSAGWVHVLRLFEGEKLAQWFIAREAPAWPIDATGSYRIPALVPGKYEICVRVEGAEPEVRVIDASPDAPREQRVDVTIGKGRSFRGRVVDPEGRPIGGALLRALQFGPGEVTPLVPPGAPEHPGRFLVGNPRVLSRKDGTYLLERVRSYVPIRLVVLKEGYRPRQIRVEPDADPPPTIVLEPAKD